MSAVVGVPRSGDNDHIPMDSHIAAEVVEDLVVGSEELGGFAEYATGIAGENVGSTGIVSPVIISV